MSMSRGSRLRCAAAAALLAFAALAAAGIAAQTAAPPAGAASGVPVNRNVYDGGGQVRTPTAVRGDYAAAGGRVVVDQPVDGDATLAGGWVDVRAAVGDDVRVLAGDVAIEAAVGGELLASGGSIVLAPSASVGRGATLYGSDVRVEGRVEGALEVRAHTVRIDAAVGGDVRLVADEIVLGPGARIGGRLHYVSDAELERAPGAVIAGPVTREAAARPAGPQPRAGSWHGQRISHASGWASGLLSFLGLLACAAVFLLLLPGFADATGRRLQRTPWLALAVGFGAAAALPVLAVLLFVTLIGLPLGVAVLALYPVLLLAGFLVGVLLLAELLAVRLVKSRPVAAGARIAWSAAALLLVLLVGWIPLAGGLLVGALALAGAGALVLEFHERLRGRAPPARAAASPPVADS